MNRSNSVDRAERLRHEERIYELRYAVTEALGVLTSMAKSEEQRVGAIQVLRRALEGQP